MKVLYPGSFDPLTKGHEEIIKRASKLFDEVVVLVANNPEKSYTFSNLERLNMIKKVIKKYPNVKADYYEGLTADYCKYNNIKLIVKGLRNDDDLASELKQDYYNKKVNNDLETVCLLSRQENILISSTAIKQLAHFKQSYSQFIPEEIIDEVEKKIK